jgi:hypothetical protein
MAVQIPQIKRSQPVGNESVGRIQTNFSALDAAQLKAPEIIGDAASKIVTTYAEHKAKAQASYDSLKADEIANKYMLEAEPHVAKFKNLPAGNDPTHAMAETEQSLKDITNKYSSMEGVTDGIRVHLDKKLSDANTSFGRDLILTNAHKGIQWKQSTLNDTASNLQTDLTNTVLLTDFNNPASVDQAKGKLDKFTALYSDPNNIEVMGDKSKILDKRGKSVDQTVQSLLAIKNIKGAEEWLKIAGTDISSEVKTTTLKKIEDAKNEEYVHKTASDLLLKTEDSALSEINKIKTTDAVKGDRIEQLYFNNLSQRKIVKNIDEQKALNLMTAKLTEMRNNGTLPLNQESARKDPAIAQTIANVKDEAKIQSALKTAGVGFDVKTPTQDTINEYAAAVRTGDIINPDKYSPEKIEDLKSRLPHTEQIKLMKTIEDLKNGQLAPKYQNQILHGAEKSIQSIYYKGKSPAEFKSIWDGDIAPRLKTYLEQSVKKHDMTSEEIFKVQQDVVKKVGEENDTRLKAIKSKGSMSERFNFFSSPPAAPTQFNPENTKALSGKSIYDILNSKPAK